ncbi:NADPH:quinone reductase [Actinoplanes sp. ATCC 53533]|uniref:zinc-binding dehydrogenase n=1 Tax=Actinoplanes sp. ATCC 53533 TaxID=1288362 RepID=UPI000F7AB7CA|nr:zinc-binding dehydrogenase [Actinoplanes sp. ATCC 53533]RSM45066.1 NADPH:quinone reductase [Actinoplanes sp. ATCC 53533]
MRVVQVARFGGPEVLEVVAAPDPVPGPGEVVVAVAAAEVLWVETMIRSGHGGDYFPVQPPYRPGPGVAGTVIDVGEGVDRSWFGRRVVTPTGPNGGYVERALEPAAGLLAVPDGVELSEAAALLHDGVTALGVLEVVALRPEDRVLITAAAGGMGALLVQLAHAAGAEVVAAAKGVRKLGRLGPLGADLVVDYSEPDWTEQVGKVSVVLDGAGGAYGRAALDLVAPGGRFSGHGTPAGSFAGPGATVAEGVTVTGIERLQFTPERFRHYAAGILAEAAAGRVRPLIGQTFPLARAADAHAALENRTAIGKTVLRCP